MAIYLKLLVGAIFLDKGYKQCEKLYLEQLLFLMWILKLLEGKVISYKSLLIEWCQKEKKTFDYDVYEDTGNDNQKHFSVKLSINDKVVAKARATSKKKAEEKASQTSLFCFSEKD